MTDGRAGRTVLIVDDNATTRKLLRTVLEVEQCEVLEAADGEGALAHMRSRVPDLIIQDLQLPDIDGMDLVKKLRGAPGGDAVPIFALSGFLTRIEEARAVGSPFTAFLVKPIEPSRLIEVIEGYLPRRGDPATTDLGAGRFLIIVDDDAVERRLLGQLFIERGFEVAAAPDGETGLSLARARPPHVVVADILMPSPDGFELCVVLRQDPSFDRTAVVLLSSHATAAADAQLGSEVGANRVVVHAPGGAGIVAAVLEAMDEGRPSSDRPAVATSNSHVRRLVKQLQREVDMNAGLRQRCAVQAARISLFASIGEAVVNREDGELTIRTVLEQCLDAAGISHGVLLLGTGGQLLVRHAVGYPALEAATLESELSGHPALARALAADQALILGPTVPDPDGRDLAMTLGVLFGLALPLVAGGKGLGVLLFGSNDTDVTVDEQRTFARILAAQLAQAVALHAAFAELARSERRYRTIVEGTHDGVWTVDRGGQTTAVNRPMAAMLGHAPEDMLGRPVTEFVPAELHAAALASLRRGAADHAPETRDARLVKKDGSEIHVRMATSSVLGSDGGYLEGVAVVTDLTDERRRQAQLMATDRLASVGMLAAAVAHEINNPLASLVANLDVAAEDVARLERTTPGLPFGELAEQISDARACAGRVRQIVRDLKIFSRADEVPRTMVNVERVLESTVRIAWGEIRHRAHLVREYGRVPPVLANEPKLGQVFLNLLVNAAQAIPEGAADRNHITVATRHDPALRSVIIEIRDSGTGMAPDVLRKLFTPFFTTKPVGEGTGLGLPICQRIVSSLGGEIAVESQLGIGTTFRVHVPIRELPVADRPAPPTASAPLARRGRLLIVDDEPMICSSLKRALRDHEVTVTTSGRAAIELLADDASRFDLVLCDLMMPEVTGMDLYDEVARRRPETAARIVFFSGGAFTSRARAFLEAVANPRIDKPVDPLTLRRLVQEWLTDGVRPVRDVV